MLLNDIFDKEELKKTLLKSEKEVRAGKKTNFFLKGLEPKEGKLTYVCYENDITKTELYEPYKIKELYHYTKDEEKYYILLEHVGDLEEFFKFVDEIMDYELDDLFEILNDDITEENIRIAPYTRDEEDETVAQYLLYIFSNVNVNVLFNLFRSLYKEDANREFQEHIYRMFIDPTDAAGNFRYID